MRAIRAVLPLLAATVAGFALTAARRHPARPPAEAPPSATLPPAPEPRPAEKTLPPPTAAEAEATLRRVFRGTVAPEAGEPPLGSDFNGDGAADLVVVVRPVAGRLGEINEPLANWMIQDALESEPAPVRRPVAADERLLAVLHGYGAEGWRNPEARQSYLVRHAAGPPFEARPRRALLRAPHRPATPRIGGDVILTTVGGRRGFVYWTSARYAWLPLPPNR
jgi:hypothetical protein